jgi:hypothetical protein
VAFTTEYINKKTINQHRLSKIGSIQHTAQVNLGSYRLELLPTMHIHLVFHVSLLEPYKKSQIPSCIPLPLLPIEIDHDVKYEVEEILDSCLRH